MGDSRALNKSRKPRRVRITTWLQAGGTTLLVGYVLIAAGLGLRQQSRGLPPQSVDCDYRAQLLRSRLVSHLDRPHTAASTANEADLDFFFTLLRETRDSCIVTNPELVAELDRLKSIFESYQRRRQIDAEVHRELLLAR